MLVRETRSTGRKVCSSATSFTTNPTWADQDWIPDLLCERPASNSAYHSKMQKLRISKLSVKTLSPVGQCCVGNRLLWIVRIREKIVWGNLKVL